MTLGNPGPMPRSHPQVSESPGVPGSPWEPNPTDPRFLKPGRSRPLTTRCGQEAPKGISNGAEVPSHTGPAGRLAAHHPLPVLLSQARACTFSTSACVVVINSWHVRTEQKPHRNLKHPRATGLWPEQGWGPRWNLGCPIETRKHRELLAPRPRQRGKPHGLHFVNQWPAVAIVAI